MATSKDVGGPDNVTIALVAPGPALKALQSTAANPDLSEHVRQFSKDGIELATCANTMKSQNISLNDLLPAFVSAGTGGVVRLAELTVCRHKNVPGSGSPRNRNSGGIELM